MISSLLSRLSIQYQENVPLSKLTGIRHNNIVPIVASPNSIGQFQKLIEHIWGQYSFGIFGGITNTYICDTYKKDIIIITKKVNEIIPIGKNSLRVGCGYNLTKISKELSEKGIKGYTGFVGIPGTIGAAAMNNSGAFHCEMKDIVIGCTVMNEKKEILYLTNTELGYTTRKSNLKGANIVLLSVDIKIGDKGNPSELLQKIKLQQNRREKTIDGHKKSLGSVFVGSSLNEIYKNHPFAMLCKKALVIPNKLLFHNRKYDTFAQFLALGHPELAKHCYNINRFCWDKDTTETDFFIYLETMQKLAKGKLQLEIEIKH